MQEPPSLAKKYEARQLDIVTQKIELPIKSLPQMFKDNDIKLNPGFQRRDRWNQEKQSRFIESIIMNVPIQPIFLGARCKKRKAIFIPCNRGMA